MSRSKFSQWYASTRWRKLRERFLTRQPLCVYCQAEGKIEPANVVDHKVPHKGDLDLFWSEDNLQPLCKLHHDSTKASEEATGKRKRVIGVDGWPI